MASSAALSNQKATYEDLFNLPENVVGEIIEGELVASPRPAIPHAFSASEIHVDLGGQFGRPPNGPNRPGGWHILVKPELHLTEDIVVPDIAGWRREKMPELPDGAYFTQAPDWVCEVISPSTAGLDRVKKGHLYAREKIMHFWIVDPMTQILEIYELHNSLWVQLESVQGNVKIKAKPFDAVELDLTYWWKQPSGAKNG